ncbi:MAG: hypothetical protein WC003_14205 [Terrimicrobiaceae bacterium]
MRHLLIPVIAIASIHRSFGADLEFNFKLASLTEHNTSASPQYDQAHFPPNFGTESQVSRTQTFEIDPSKMDLSMNAASPGHVSGADVHTLIPSRPNLRWFAHLMGWWGSGKPFDIGVDMDTDEYIAKMIADMRRRGFDGVIVCWNSPGSRDDRIVRRIQSHLKTLPPGSFSFMVLIDQGLIDKLQTTEAQKKRLEEAVNYCKANFFDDPNYERDGGKPMLMFYGVRAFFGKVAGRAGGAAAALSEVKAATGGDMVWADVLPSYLNEDWEDQAYDWHDAHPNGPNPKDPYNFASIQHFYDSVKDSGKKVIGAMSAGYNGTLSKLDGGWAVGHYLPQDNGKCLIERARFIESILPVNVTHMQWVTWNDWAEGTSAEPGIENNIAVDASIEGSTLKWSVSGGSGDESTINHYDIYASPDGENAALLASVPTGKGAFDLASVAGLKADPPYDIVVVAVGKPCIRNHAAPPVKYGAAHSRQNESQPHADQ